MEIKVLNEPNLDDALKAWKISRPKETETDLKEILSIDCPVNDMPTFLLHIKSTIIEREIIASLRDHVIWARSTRVDDIENFEINNIFSSFPFYSIIRNKIIEEKLNGAPQNEYRLMMPIVAMTEYTLKISLRSLIKLFHHFLWLSNNTNFKQLFQISCIRIEKVLHKTLLENFHVMYSYKHVNFNPPIKVKNEEELVSYPNGFIAIQTTIPFSLRTHLIRHNLLFINDSLLEIMNKEDCSFKTIKEPVKIQICASTSVWKEILRKRSCWMTHYSMWSKIINLFSSEIKNEREYLPCGGDGKKCPFGADAELRYTEKDPGIPCPIFTKDNSKIISKETIIEMKKQIKRENRPNFWNNEIT